MHAPLLSTKLYIPRRQPLSQQTTLVPRPRLLEKLVAGMAGKLTLIAAPAGFGKSTLLSAWIGETEATLAVTTSADSSKNSYRQTFCWLSLEEGDNDPIRFWVYFIAALQSLNPDLSTDASVLLQSPEPPPLETILTILLNDLNSWSSLNVSEIAPEIVLILEDYHLIAAPAIHQSLTFLLDHLPSSLHLVMTTRADPPLPLARLRARGQLSEIRADDLRFTAAETALFLNERMGLRLSSDEVQLLAARTEGWIAGLQLAALSMHGYDDKASFVRSFSGDHRYILNYLIEEVLNQQPKAVQDFLLQTSILTRLCGPLCDAVMDAGKRTEIATSSSEPLQLDSQAMLAHLDQANLFVVPLDDSGQWYRYHQLFAEVLQHRLRQSQPETLPVLHRRACLWLAEQAYLADAIKHALLAADFAYAAELIEQVWPTLWDQGAVSTLFTWMQALSADDLRGDDLSRDGLWKRPGLYVSYAWGLALTGQIEAAEATLCRIEATLQRADAAIAASSHHTILLGQAAALRAMLAARRGLSTDAALLAEQALALIPADALARGDAYYALGLAKQMQGILTEAFQAYGAAAKLSQAANNSFLTIAARYHEARILMAQGNLQKAATTYQQVLAVAAQSQKQLPVVGLAHVGYGEILYQRNDLVAATHHVDIGLALSPRRDLTYTDGPLHRFSILARVRQAQGDLDGALAAVELAKEMAQQTGIGLDVERAAAIEALIHLRLRGQVVTEQGVTKLAVTKQWAADYVRRRTDAELFTYLYEFETLVFVRILLAHNRVDEALALLEKWLPIVETAQRKGTLIELYMLQGLALHLGNQSGNQSANQSGNQSDAAMATLAHALALAEPEEYIRLFVDEGEIMRTAIGGFRSYQRKLLGGKQLSREVHANSEAYTGKLLRAFTDAESPLDKSAGADSVKKHALIESLTAREFEVLRLLADGLSNAAIAEQLVVSVGTVKTHLKRIYSKLIVKSRTQAVAQGRALGLL